MRNIRCIVWQNRRYVSKLDAKFAQTSRWHASLDNERNRIDIFVCNRKVPRPGNFFSYVLSAYLKRKYIRTSVICYMGLSNDQSIKHCSGNLELGCYFSEISSSRVSDMPCHAIILTFPCAVFHEIKFFSTTEMFAYRRWFVKKRSVFRLFFTAWKFHNVTDNVKFFKLLFQPGFWNFEMCG